MFKIIFIYLFFIILLSGCQTLKSVGDSIYGIGKGIKEDVSNTYRNIKSIDEKIWK